MLFFCEYWSISWDACERKDIQARELHVVVEESASQLRDALTDMQRSVNRMASEAGVIHGVVENISRSIALTDETSSHTVRYSFATFLHSLH